MKTLFVNPPSFEKFDGGASARYQATREITSFWYPVWLAYPAGLVKDSRLLDGPAQGVTPDDAVTIAQDYEFVVLYTSTAGFMSDIRLAEQIKANHPQTTIAFVGPHVTIGPEESLKASTALDFVVRGEFDHAVAEFAEGLPLADIAGVSYRQGDRIIQNPVRPLMQDRDALPFAVDVYKRDLDYTKYNIPYLLHPYVSFYTSRGCPALCTFCLWPQTMSGHPWRTRSVPNVVVEVQRCRELFPQAKELFFDDDTFPGLDRRYMVEMVERFYDRYYFRPKVIFRILRRAAFDGAKRRRLYHEAKEFLQLRAKRRRFAQTSSN